MRRLKVEQFSRFHKSNKPNNRLLKIADEIKKTLVDCFRFSTKLDTRLLEGKVTVTRVIPPTSQNLGALYHCYILPFSYTRLSEQELMDAINNSFAVIKKYVTEKINLKYAPELKFSYDYGFENADQIGSILNQI